MWFAWTFSQFVHVKENAPCRRGLFAASPTLLPPPPSQMALVQAKFNLDGISVTPDSDMRLAAVPQCCHAACGHAAVRGHPRRSFFRSSFNSSLWPKTPGKHTRGARTQHGGCARVHRGERCSPRLRALLMLRPSQSSTRSCWGASAATQCRCRRSGRHRRHYEVRVLGGPTAAAGGDVDGQRGDHG